MDTLPDACVDLEEKIKEQAAATKAAEAACEDMKRQLETAESKLTQSEIAATKRAAEVADTKAAVKAAEAAKKVQSQLDIIYLDLFT